MTLENHILNTIKNHDKNKLPIKILFPEGENEKVQAVALKLVAEKFTDEHNKPVPVSDLIQPILLFNANEIIPHNIKDKVTTIISENQAELANKLYELRKAKGLTLEQAQKLVTGKNYFGMMLLESNTVDCFVGGINFTTADILRPALQVIKPRKDVKTVSSCFIMNKEQSTFIFSDGSINIDPNEDQIVDIATSAVHCAQSLNLKDYDKKDFSEIKLALLSYSSNGSGTGENVDKMKNATAKLAKVNWGQEKVNIAGEIQFDAAFDQEVRKKKFPELKFDGPCNIYIFPDLEAANIGYKIAQRLGGYKAIGPIVLGLNKPVNDLSRGATVDDIYFTALITCAQSLLNK